MEVKQSFESIGSSAKSEYPKKLKLILVFKLYKKTRALFKKKEVFLVSITKKSSRTPVNT